METKDIHQDKASNDPDDVAKIRKVGAGGAWRAFVHYHQRGSKMSPGRMQELGEMYRNLSVEDKAYFNFMGNTATNNRKAGTSTFPMHSRRSKFSRGQPATCNSLDTEDLATHNSHAQTLASIAKGCLTPLTASSLVELQDKNAHLDTVEEAATENAQEYIRLALRIYSRVFKKELRDKRKTESDRGKQLSQRLSSQALRDLQTRQRLANIPLASWVSLPFSSTALSCSLDNVKVPVVSEMQPTNEAEDTVAGLATSWDRKHMGIRHTTWQCFERRRPLQTCLTHGVCVCHGHGRYLGRIKQNLAQYLKDLSGRASFETALRSGYVVLHWCLSSVSHGDGDPAGPSVENNKHFFTHIGMIYYKPWRITIAHLQLAHDLPPPEVLLQDDAGNLGPTRLSLTFSRAEETVDADTLLRFLLTLDLTHKLAVDTWTLSSRSTPVASLNAVVADKVPGPGRCLWNGEAQEAATRRRRRPAHEVLDDDRGIPRHRFRTGNVEETHPTDMDTVPSQVDTASEPESSMEEICEGDLGEEHFKSDEPEAPMNGGLLQQEFQPLMEIAGSEAARSTDDVTSELEPQLLEHPGKWGPYGFSLKHPHQQGRFGGYQVSCPFHRRNAVTGCKKFVPLEAWTESAKRKAIQLARWWATQSSLFETQADHLKKADLNWERCPTLEELHRVRPTEAPVTKPLSDVQLKLRSVSQERHDESDQATSSNSRAKGSESRRSAELRSTGSVSNEAEMGEELERRSSSTNKSTSDSSESSSS